MRPRSATQHCEPVPPAREPDWEPAGRAKDLSRVRWHAWCARAPDRLCAALFFAFPRDPRQVAILSRAKARRTAGLRTGTRRTRLDYSVQWTLRYLGQHVAQKVLGAVPYGYRLQEFVKRATRRLDRFGAVDSIREGARKKIDRFNAAGLEPPGVVVEQGTGWHGFDLVLFHLGGARRILTYDTTPWLRPDLLRRNAEVLAASPDIVKRWRGCVPEGVDERAERLRGSLDCPWETLLERLGVRVRVTRSMDRSEIGSGSVDLFYSNSVLQFMAPRDLAMLVRQAHRFLKPSGVSFHVIDCSDLHAANDRRISRLAYLTYPDALWKLLTSRYLNYQNRLRMPQFAELFDREGLASEVVNPVLSPEDVEFTRRHLARDRRFRSMSAKEIAVRSFWLKGIATAP